MLSKADKDLAEQALKSAALTAKHGKVAAVVHAGRGLNSADVAKILRKEKRISDRLFELVMSAEREALRRRFL
jgi:hypothetical protein